MKLEGRLEGFILIASASVMWGSDGVIVDIVPLPSDAIAFFRVLLATAFLFPFLPRGQFKAEWKSLVFLGVILSIGWTALFQSMKMIPIGIASFLNYTAPIFVAVMAKPTLGERVSKKGWLALGVATVGMLLISSESLTGSLDPLGIAFALLSGALYAIFIIHSKKLVYRLPVMSVAFYSYLVSALILAPSIFRIGLNFSLETWILLILMGSLNTALAITIYFKGLKLIKAHEAAVLSYLEPVSALAFGYVFLAQNPSLLTLVGGALIILAGYLIARPQGGLKATKRKA